MAQVEPMDIDAIECDFDNKENSYHHSNVLSRTPCTEKGYEELDVSELNMKLRYSTTPTPSPMSKSLTGCLDSKNFNQGEKKASTENGNLTRSLNSTFNRNENLNKSKILPLQTLSTDPVIDSNRNASMLRLLEPDGNITISVSTNSIDDNLSLPSTSSSVAQTPEATTPTKEIPKPEGSPILRGLKSVLSMFRPSQSPIPSAEDDVQKQDVLSPVESQLTYNNESLQSVLASTPVATSKQKDNNVSKRSSPLKESVVFNDDLERELQWKDETTIIFKQEKIPVHKLFFQNLLAPRELKKTDVEEGNLNNTVEYMDISCNESLGADKTMIVEQNKDIHAVESDNEFLDCETTFTKNESDAPVIKNIELGIGLINDKEESTSELNIINKTECTKSQTVESLGNISKLTSPNIMENEFTQVIDATKNEHIKSEISNNLESNESSDHTTSNKMESKFTEIIDATKEEESQEKSSLLELTNKKEDKPYEAIDVSEKHVENESYSITHEKNNLLLPPKDTSSQIDAQNYSTILQDLNATSAIIDSIDNELNSISIKSIIDDLSATKGEESLGNIKIKDSKITEDPKETVTTLENPPDVCIETLQSHENLQSLQTYNVNLGTIEDNIKPLMLNDDINELRNYDYTNNANPVDTLLNNQEQRIHNFGDMESNLNISIHKDNKTLPENKNVNETIENNNMTIAMKHETVEKNISTTLESLPVFQSELNLDHKIEKNNFNTSHSDTTAKADINNEENVMNTNMSVSNTEIQIRNVQVFDVPCNDTFNKSTPLDLDREVPELTVLSNIVTHMPPSDIPLPDDDDDDIEKDNVKNDRTTDITNATFEKGNETMYVKNTTKSAAEFEELNNLTSTQHIMEHIETGLEIVMKGMDVNEINNVYEIMDTHTKPDINCDKAAEILTSYMENLNADNLPTGANRQMGISELQNFNNNIEIAENVSQPLESQETITNSVDALEMPKTQNICKTMDIKMEKDIAGSKFSHIEIFSSSQQDEEDRSPELSSNMNDNTANVNKCSTEMLENQVRVENDVLEKSLQEIDEEIITSANNSPYVSVSDLVLDTKPDCQETNEGTVNTFTAETKIASSPLVSPKIVSKGYNFNFDEIDDPFATKTKIRMSPTPESSENTLHTTLEGEINNSEVSSKKITNNRRKSQPERKRPAQKKNFNSTFSGQLPAKEKASKTSKQKQTTAISKDNLSNIVPTPPVTVSDDIESENTVTATTDLEKAFQNADTIVPDVVESSAFGVHQASPCDEKQEFHADEGIKCLEQTLVISDLKSTSSSEQYFSLGTSSGESVNILNQSKNVFNLPEIDDMNFNPFATKSKICQSPPPSENNTIPIKEVNMAEQSSFVSDEKERENMSKHIDECDVTFDKTVIKDSSPNTSNATCSSKSTTDRDSTARIVLTEDEDTIEGPFLEADDLKDIEKFTEMDTEGDMMNFDDTPQEREENIENGELFIDADAFEFLLNQNKSTIVSDSGKESLFLKFDPLFANRVSSDGVLAALTKLQKKQSTPKKITAPKQKLSTNNEKAGPSNTRENYVPVEEYSEDLTSTIAKPMMVVTPAVSSIVSPRIQATTTPKINRRSLTFTSPAIAVIDRLLSLSGNSSHLNPDTSIPNINTHSETDLALTQLRELLAEKEIHVHNLRCESKELKSRLAALELQVRTLETESTERLSKINELNDNLSEKTKINKSMATVVEEYERTIASLIAEIEHDKKRNAEERMRLIKERDEQTAHLTSMEVSFSDLHSKYEKNKQIILTCKANEDKYKKSIKEFEDNFSKMQTNYELLKQHATSKLNHANQEFEKLNRAHEAEVLKLNAMIKRKDLHITSLEETLAQKTKANEELTAICDELINKVG